MKSSLQFAFWVLLLLCLCGLAHGQAINSGIKTITLSATLTDSISVNVSATAVNFTLSGGSANNPGSTNIIATTNWNTRPGRNLSTYAYFATSAAALTDGAGDNIPSSAFGVSINGAARVPLSNTAPFGGASAGLRLFTVKITGTNKTGSHSDTLDFNIDLSALPQLPAGTYTGTLNIQAQAI